MKMKLSIMLILLCFAALPIFAGGSSEQEVAVETGVQIPDGPSRPSLPRVLRNSDDFALVQEAYGQLLLEMDPIIDSIVYNGLEANTAVLDDLRDVTEWWRDYISSLRIETESPSVSTDSIDEFFGGLIRLDRQLESKLSEINRLIDLENEAGEQ